MGLISAARHLVVGVDGSSESVAALMWACREASLSDADVVAVLAVEAPYHHGGYAVPAPRSAKGSWGSAREVLRASVSEAADRFPGVNVRTRVAEGLAARVLLDHAADADMLVLGRTPHPADPGHSAGPVVRSCLRSAMCPVVVVAPAEDTATAEPSVHLPQRRGT